MLADTGGLVVAIVVPIACVLLSAILAALGWLFRELLRDIQKLHTHVDRMSKAMLPLGEDVRALKRMHNQSSHPNGHRPPRL